MKIMDNTYWRCSRTHIATEAVFSMLKLVKKLRKACLKSLMFRVSVILKSARNLVRHISKPMIEVSTTKRTTKSSSSISKNNV
jgi:hypothetical protein